jgi:hypothetical protein
MKFFKSFNKLLILFTVLILIGFFYKRFQDKIVKEENNENYKAIQDYLLDDVTLGKSKKPILWIHVPYEYNSRRWLSFGSRSSFDLNQPYLYLTIRSIIKNCDKSFTICIVDDNSFQKLIPDWNINLSIISGEVLSNMRMFGMMQLLYIYGGMQCPISFLCIKDLIGLYNKGTMGDKMFVCETINRNSSSNYKDFAPSLSFCGARKELPKVKELIHFMQKTISTDYTAESKFIGEFDNWCNHNIKMNKINLIKGCDIGTKTIHEKQIVLDDLMSNHYLDLYTGAYGILIPANELLNRIKYEWFVRMSEKQVLESDTIIGNYLLLSVSPQKGILEPLEPIINKKVEKNFVGFWKTPNYPGLYGLKPNFLGDNLYKQNYTGR